MAEKQSSLGLSGYDPISYFENGKPRLGKFDYKTNVNGVIYCFTCQRNLDRFLKRPTDFIPQFGGNCAFSCGLLGKLKPGSHLSWKIVDGKLYLNSNAIVGKIWEFLPSLIERGHDNYRAKTA